MTRGWRRPDRTAAYVIAGFVVALLAVAVVAWPDDAADEPGSAPAVSTSAAISAAGARWVVRSEEAFAPIQLLPEVAVALDRWRRGEASGSTVTAQLASLGEALDTIESDLVALGPHPSEPTAAPLHLATARLYAASVDVEAVALALSPGELTTQLDAVARRIQVLANRVFDRGRAAVGQGPAADLGPDVVVHRPDAVPSWSDERLVPAAPLAGPSAPIPSVPPSPDWAGAAAAVVPSDLIPVADGAPADLLAQAEVLGAAARALGEIPDPDGGDRSTRVLLGLLLRAEASRLATAAVLTDRPELLRAAQLVETIALTPVLRLTAR